jgi:membrane carboxypeptidase/penicillin-binding protein PbpC
MFSNSLLREYERKSFSVWPSNVVRFLERSGKKVAGIPSFEKGCESFDLASPITGKNEFDQLGIVSPTGFVYYQNPMDSSRTSDPVPLVARALADSERLFWFENDKLLGEVKNIANQEVHPLMWTPKPGVSKIRVMDLRGRSATIVVKTQATL